MNDIIRANVEQRRKTMAMALKHWVIAGLLVCAAAARAAVPDTWTQPAAALADQVSAILGPGQAHLVLHNISTVANDQLPALRKALTQSLKAHGVTLSGAESANTVRITLSETATERLLVAEVMEGSTTQIAIVRFEREPSEISSAVEHIVLRKETYLKAGQLAGEFGKFEDISKKPVLFVAETHGGLVVLESGQIAIFAMTFTDWREEKQIDLGVRGKLLRDPRGSLDVLPERNGFVANLPSRRCVGSYAPPTDNSGHYGEWSIQCADSDDPWPLTMAGGTTQLKAFYNAARNFFTGVVTPNVGADLPAFYSAALLPRAAGNGALLIGGVDGKVQIAENNALRNVSGARDWGSDFAVLNSGCGAGAQIVASASGAAANDSLRAYELPALEAVPVSAPLAVQGAVTALWSAPDGKSVYAVVRDAEDRYEVDRVTALCN